MEWQTIFAWVLALGWIAVAVWDTKRKQKSAKQDKATIHPMPNTQPPNKLADSQLGQQTDAEAQAAALNQEIEPVVTPKKEPISISRTSSRLPDNVVCVDGRFYLKSPVTSNLQPENTTEPKPGFEHTGNKTQQDEEVSFPLPSNVECIDGRFRLTKEPYEEPKQSGSANQHTDKSKKTNEWDDISFLQEIKHIESGFWQQYDILLAAWGYGWDTMVDWAQYMADGDLKPINTLTAALMVHSGETEFIEQYRERGEKIANVPDLVEEEWSSLAVGGFSNALCHAPVKIVWFNQTRILRIFSPVRDETQLRRYAETVARRTFGTEDAMKLARQIEKTEENKP